MYNRGNNMSLIKCPECGSEISDKSEKCIHCGYPLQEKYIHTINGRNYNLKFIYESTIDNKAITIGNLRRLTNCTLSDANNIVTAIQNGNKIPKTINLKPQPPKTENKTSDSSNTIHCPTCNSTNVKKISVTSKLGGAMMFGLLSKTAKSQFKCNNCGYKW